MSTEIDEIGWRRAWGLFDYDELVGHLQLVCGRSARSCTEPTWVWAARARIVAGEVATCSSTQRSHGLAVRRLSHG